MLHYSALIFNRRWMKESIVNPHDSATQWLETFHITQYVMIIIIFINRRDPQSPLDLL